MRTPISIRLIVLSLLFGTVSIALAGGPSPLRSGARHRQDTAGGSHERREHNCANCRIEMRTVQRTVYERVEETRQATVYDVVWDQQTLHETQRRVIMQQREVPYTFYRTLVERQTREVPYTTYRSFPETHTRQVAYLTRVPVSETRTVTVPYTVCRTVEEQRTRTVYCSVPRQVTGTHTVYVRSGHWEYRETKGDDKSTQKGDSEGNCQRVWVSCVQERQVAHTRTVYDLKARVVPYTVTRTVPETRTREVTRTCTRLVPIQQTRLVHYQVLRSIPEQHVKTVSYLVQRQVPETSYRVECFPTYQDVPTTRVVGVPRQVPRTVCYKVTKIVPRVECVQVPVRVCIPSDPDGSTQKGHDNKVADGRRSA
jgi:hypothetical protein